LATRIACDRILPLETNFCLFWTRNKEIYQSFIAAQPF
jgi:hypothetical protein